jgi:hypothetical protein
MTIRVGALDRAGDQAVRETNALAGSGTAVLEAVLVGGVEL